MWQGMWQDIQVCSKPELLITILSSVKCNIVWMLSNGNEMHIVTLALLVIINIFKISHQC